MLPERLGAARNGQQQQGGEEAGSSSHPLVSLQNPCTFAAGASCVVRVCVCVCVCINVCVLVLACACMRVCVYGGGHVCGSRSVRVCAKV